MTDLGAMVCESRDVQRRVRADLGPLQDLLLICCPGEIVDGRETPVVSISILARHMKLTSEAIHKWIRNNNTVPPDKVVELVALSEGRVTKEDFAPYVYK